MANDKDYRRAFEAALKAHDARRYEAVKGTDIIEAAYEGFRLGAAWQQSHQSVVTEENAARAFCIASGINPDACPKINERDANPEPLWCDHIPAARKLLSALGCMPSQVKPQISEETAKGCSHVFIKGELHFDDKIEATRPFCFKCGRPKAAIEAIRKAGV